LLQDHGLVYDDAMRFHLPNLLLTCFACIAVPTSFAADQATPAGVAFFEKQIRPLLSEHCYQCHSSRAGSSEGELFLDSQQGWTTGGDSGPAVIPRDVDASLLMRAVRYSDAELQMPPDQKLSKDQIERLERWIRLGAPAPRDDSLRAMHHPNPADPIAGREHWAFRPLDDAMPVAASSDWPRSSIDDYIGARLQEANLRPAPDADRRELVRRVHIRLTGLAPTAEQIESFVADRRPDALPRLVDLLLDSPQFGAQWGRHWLDLARYADSNGLDENFLFREAWRYRNWVIDAINADIPFDRFVLEQIAGDLLPYDSIEQRDRQRIAAGFLVVGPKVLLGNDPKRQRMEVADEQIDTIGRAILGQTLGCARCHDHKFDPIPTADYYALAGILTSTEVMERRYMLNQQRVMERLVGLGPEGDQLDSSYEKYWREHPALRERGKHAQSALELLEKDDSDALQKLINDHSDAVSAEAADAGLPKQERVASQKALLADLVRRLSLPAKIPPRAMIPTDVESPEDEHIRLAGRFDRLGDQVPRGVLQVLRDCEIEIGDGSSGRLDLSRWLTDEQHGAGRLTARVLANRIWHHLIGRGIVRTVDNFGRTGEAATHPQLLDHLARQLIESGWSIKQLVRSIVLSRTFAISSGHDDAGHAIDPENRLHWRAHRRRLSPESLRDSMLAAAGKLDLTPMKSSVWYLGDQATAVGANKVRRRTDFPCRSVYLPVIRNDLPELFDAFDFADPHATTGLRAETADSIQGLFLLNDDLVMDAAMAVAGRLSAGEKNEDLGAKVDKMCELILGGAPSDDDRAELTTFIRQTRERLREQGDTEADERAWAIACHALFASSRFQIVE
jgi:hypothetical protein